MYPIMGHKKRIRLTQFGSPHAMHIQPLDSKFMSGVGVLHFYWNFERTRNITSGERRLPPAPE